MLLAPAKKGGMLCAERAAKPNLNAYFLSPATRFVAKPCTLKTPQPEYSFGDLPSKKESHLSRGESSRMFLSFSALVGDPKISKHCKKPSAESSPRSRPSVSESEITPAPIRLNARATSWGGINDGSLGVRGTKTLEILRPPLRRFRRHRCQGLHNTPSTSNHLWEISGFGGFQSLPNTTVNTPNVDHGYLKLPNLYLFSSTSKNYIIPTKDHKNTNLAWN